MITKYWAGAPVYVWQCGSFFLTDLYCGVCSSNKEINVTHSLEYKQSIGYVCTEPLHKTSAIVPEHNGSAL